jgi:hypothetical protein
MKILHKNCSKCNLELPVDSFYVNRLTCKTCLKKAGYANRAKNIDKYREYQSKWRAENREKSNSYSKRWRTDNPEKQYQASRNWMTSVPGRQYFYSRSRKNHVKQATPPWANMKYIRLFYEMAKLEEERLGVPVHVDHIIPLKGKNVCGLHVEDNLQLLTAKDNLQKMNKYA